MNVTNSVLEQFKRGGQGFTFDEWNRLDVDTMAIAIEVQTALNKEQAALVAFYLSNPDEMFQVLGGEDAAVRAVLQGKAR